MIHSAGCLIIGDEVLNGKILDTNSHHFAKKCFDDLSIPLKKTIVCSDLKQDIRDSINLLSKQCDFIVTSGGIGPTHDDVTYEALADAFGLSCELDEETVEKMRKLRKGHMESLEKDQLVAYLRMATLPVGNENVEVEKLYISNALWVPIVGINEQVYILPGIPSLFAKLLHGLFDSIRPRVAGVGLTRRFVLTQNKESMFAPFLLRLQQEYDLKYGMGNVKLGSYPHLEFQKNTVSIIANSSVSKSELNDIIDRIISGIQGDAKEISKEEEETYSK